MSLLERMAYQKKAWHILKSRPILAILGPRQCGKTTLAREFLGQGLVLLDLERPSDFAKLAAEPELYLKEARTSPTPLVIDEAQRMPELFPILRAEADDRKKKGQFIILGSSSWNLIKSLSESLAGRVGFLDLSPLCLFELHSQTSLWEHWIKGGFPDALLQGQSETLNFDWHEDYTRALIERDLPAMGIDISPLQFRTLWAMCTHFHGEILNMNTMANSLDISAHTVKRYLDILEHTYMLRRLMPLRENLKKRLIKSPKLYIRDSGSFHYFHKILSRQDLMVHPSLGKSFEGYVVELILQINALHTPEYHPSFFRTSDGIEVDLVLKKGRRAIPIEIKATVSPTLKMAKSLQKMIAIMGLKRGYLIHLGDESFPLSRHIRAVSIHHWRKEGLAPFWGSQST